MSSTDPLNITDRLARIETRLDAMQGELTELRAMLTRMLNDHESRLRCVEDESIRQQEQRRIAAALQATFTTLSAIIAGWIGSRK